MSRSRTQNRLTIRWDIRGKKLELSAAGFAAVVGLLLLIVAVTVVVRML